MKFISTCVSILFIGEALILEAQNSPVLTLGSVSTTASDITIPITAVGFSNITSGNLKILYDPAVAVPIAVKKGPGLAGTLDSNISVPGIIRLGWFTYPSVNLSDESVVINIEFTKTGTGTSVISFEDGIYSPLDCQFYNGSHQKLNDEPFSTYYIPGSLAFIEHSGPVTTAPDLTATINENIDVPITVTDFKNVGAVSLAMNYDPAVLEFHSAENTGGFPDLIIHNPLPGILSVSGNTNTPGGYSLPDGTIFFTMNFTYLGGATDLSWNDDGKSCEYEGPQSAYVLPDTPQAEYYIDGRVDQFPAPVAPDVNPTHPTCTDSTGTIEVTSPIGSEYTYSIDGVNYQSSPVFGGLDAGTYSVTVKNNEEWVSTAIVAIINDPPHTPVRPIVKVNAATCEDQGSASVTNYFPAKSYTFSPSGPVADATGNIKGYITGSIYTVTAVNAEGCESEASEPFIIGDKLEAPEPTITMNKSTESCEGECILLTASEGDSYLWSTGETTQSITVSKTGEFTVAVTYQNGCSAVSSPLSIIISNAQQIATTNARLEIKAYPNPFSEQLKIEFIAYESAHACIEIYDIHERLVQTLFNQHVSPRVMYHAEFNPAAETGGTYIYRINLNGSVHTGKVIYKK